MRYNDSTSRSIRTRILDAAVTLIVETGFASTSALAVQRAAGVSRGSLLHQFPTSENLLGAAAERLVHLNLQSVRDELARTPSQPDAVERAVLVLYRASKRPAFAAEMEIWTASRVNPALAQSVGDPERSARTDLHAIVDECFGPALVAHPRYPEVAELTVHLLRGLTVSRALRGLASSAAVVDQWIAIARALLATPGNESPGVPELNTINPIHGATQRRHLQVTPSPNGGNTMSATHEVLNQAEPHEGHDLSTFPALLEGMRREGADWAETEVREIGQRAGSAQSQEWARIANEQPPVLKTHDRFGVRIDEVEFVPAYHELMTVAIESGLGGVAWRSDRPGAHVARSAKFMSWGATEFGHLCPVSMNYAVVPSLRHSPELASKFEPLMTSPIYEPGLQIPLEKAGLIAGMSMTEKQGGSDVRANTTTATEQADGSYRLLGHKWFTSAPMSDMFLTLAQTSTGLSCFLVPRVLDDGTRNAFHLQRLKDKLGNRSNASAEIEYDNAVGWLVGEEGRGVPTIIDMVNMTRLDVSAMAAAGMRVGTARALHHTQHRNAFGSVLSKQPAMENVLADLAVESEAATTLVLRMAGSVDRAARGDDTDAAFRRIGLAVTKYWLCKRWASHSVEAMECLGGNGYIEESGMPRLYREAPLASIWEGSGNVNALDTLRAVTRQPETLSALFAELELATGHDSRYDDRLAMLQKGFADDEQQPYRARSLVESSAVLIQANLLMRHGNPSVAEAFLATRIAGEWGHTFGTLPTGIDTDTILNRAAIDG